MTEVCTECSETSFGSAETYTVIDAPVQVSNAIHSQTNCFELL